MFSTLDTHAVGHVRTGFETVGPESAMRAAARASVPHALITTTVYVVDTSVLLADPLAVTRFAEHEVVLPLVVLTELEGKRHHPELGWAARQSLRLLEDLRTRHGSLLEPMPVNDDGGTLRVELNHQDLGALPPPLTSDANDHWATIPQIREMAGAL